MGLNESIREERELPVIEESFYRLMNENLFSKEILQGLKRKDSLELKMTEKMDSGEVTNFKALLLTNAIQLDALAELLIEKGIITEEEFFDRLKKVQAEYQEHEKPEKQG